MENLDLTAQRDAIIAEIHAAFGTVTRDGGVSWSEAGVIDDYGDDEERAAARRGDTDRSWQELVGSQRWRPDQTSAFAFLDAVGFRYYLPPAMIRVLRGKHVEGIEFTLELPQPKPRDTRPGLRAYHFDQWSLLDERQRRCVARFLRFMIAASAGDAINAADWQRAYDSYWAQVGE